MDNYKIQGIAENAISFTDNSINFVLEAVTDRLYYRCGPLVDLKEIWKVEDGDAEKLVKTLNFYEGLVY